MGFGQRVAGSGVTGDGGGREAASVNGAERNMTRKNSRGIHSSLCVIECNFFYYVDLNAFLHCSVFFVNPLHLRIFLSLTAYPRTHLPVYIFHFHQFVFLLIISISFLLAQTSYIHITLSSNFLFPLVIFLYPICVFYQLFILLLDYPCTVQFVAQVDPDKPVTCVQSVCREKEEHGWRAPSTASQQASLTPPRFPSSSSP